MCGPSLAIPTQIPVSAAIQSGTLRCQARHFDALLKYLHQSQCSPHVQVPTPVSREASLLLSFYIQGGNQFHWGEPTYNHTYGPILLTDRPGECPYICGNVSKRQVKGLFGFSRVGKRINSRTQRLRVILHISDNLVINYPTFSLKDFIAITEHSNLLRYRFSPVFAIHFLNKETDQISIN